MSDCAEKSKPLLSIVMPCLNEEKTVGLCIQEAFQFLQDSGIKGEVIVADNGSSDQSKEKILAAGAILVEVSRRGYGCALRAAIERAQGDYVIMADSDHSYHFQHSQRFLDKLKNGDQLVLGNRFLGSIEAGAMPKLHQYFGNPMMSFLGRCLFGLSLGDFHCGMRGIQKSFYDELHLRAPGMEFASELIVRSALKGARIAEVATDLRKDGRGRPPHLRSFRDGFRHLFLRLAYRADRLLFAPGLLFVLAAFLACLSQPESVTFAALLFCAFQCFSFGLILCQFSMSTGLTMPRLILALATPLKTLALTVALGLAGGIGLFLNVPEYPPGALVELALALEGALLSFTGFAMSLWRVEED